MGRQLKKHFKYKPVFPADLRNVWWQFLLLRQFLLEIFAGCILYCIAYCTESKNVSPTYLFSLNWYCPLPFLFHMCLCYFLLDFWMNECWKQRSNWSSQNGEVTGFSIHYYKCILFLQVKMIGSPKKQSRKVCSYIKGITDMRLICETLPSNFRIV